MSIYQLPVRGETVTITFKRINDSRRLPGYIDSQKKPNLFNIRAVTKCQIILPRPLGPEWYTQSTGIPSDWGYSHDGYAYCHRRDDWCSKKGRHESLREALNYLDHDKALNGEIMAAFLAEEKRREKAKGPARKPRTGKPKQRRTGRGLIQILAELREALDRTLPPTTEAGASLPVLNFDEFMPGETIAEGDARYYAPKPNGGATLPAE